MLYKALGSEYRPVSYMPFYSTASSVKGLKLLKENLHVHSATRTQPAYQTTAPR